MRRVFPLLLFLFALLAVACASSTTDQAAGGEQAGPVVKVFYSPT